MPLTLDRFLRHDELCAELDALSAAHPGLVTVETYGQSFEGRPLRLVTVTDVSTGAHEEKPAMWVDANIHATELTASVAALALLAHLVEGYGSDPMVTEALRTRTFYVVPRVNPDGAELALADRPRLLRSSVRPWPWTDGWSEPGLHPEDLDGDGAIRTMRIADPAGGWTTHPDDDAVMVPIPIGGWTERPRYRLLPEGAIDGYDGYTIRTPGNPERLDLNRNFPAGWDTRVEGAGDHPGSEPEIAALIAAIVARPNICGTNAYHTWGGVLLRPSSTKPDSSLPPGDVWTWNRLGERCTALTGYPVHSVYEDFTWDKSDTMSGAADDWAYEHLGVFSWTTEFWDVIYAATGTRAPTSIWYETPDDATTLAVAAWFAENHPGMYAPWRPFDHPQLGPVEIGGLDRVRAMNNPPPERLPEVVAGHPRFAVEQALAAPALAIEMTRARPLGDGVWRVEAGIANTGWLPTQISVHAAKKDLVLPVTAEMTLPTGAELVAGDQRQLLGQLAGAGAARFAHSTDATAHRALAAWVVRACAGTQLTVTARHPRAGVARATVLLGA